MAKERARLLQSEDVAEGTKAFYFEKPAGFSFVAGQSIDLTLVEPPETDTEGNMRAYSIAAAPHEEHLMIATRLRDTAFKRSIAKLPIGTEVQIEGPFGSFTLHNNSEKPAVFLTGGIGITVVRSIVLDAAHRALTHRIFVFYSNRRPEDAVFLEEFSSLATQMPNLTFVPTMTQMENSAHTWSGETGYITKEMIEKRLPDMHSAIYYLDGPMSMVNAMRTLLVDAHIDTDNIKTEEFPGY